MDNEIEMMVDQLIETIDRNDLSRRAVKEAMMSKMTAALAAGRARDGFLISIANFVLLIILIALQLL
ncbi:MAG TPA: hypothetical protein VNS34_14335 [Rhizobiaceae bacterium]|nr:hypothetical protein [Rhizobiaceae bacterium]